MSNPWYGPAVKLNGEHANYQAGQITVTTGLCHYTVGRNSTGTCGRDFQFVIERDGTVYQGAPVDARCWGAGDPWNGCAVHIEIEYLDEETIFTDAAREACGALLRWLSGEWGIPLQHYGGPRIAEFNGFIDHGSVIQTGEQHTDYWPKADWDLMVLGDPDLILQQHLKGEAMSDGLELAISPKTGEVVIVVINQEHSFFVQSRGKNPTDPWSGWVGLGGIAGSAVGTDAKS